MFKYIFLFFLIVTFVPAVRRFLFWLVVGRQLVKEQKRYYQQTQAEAKPKRKAGEVNIDYVPPKTGKPEFNGGQYVDYEEVKE